VDPADRNSSYVLTLAAIEKAHADKGRQLTLEEKAFTLAWINAARSDIGEYQRVIDEPLPVEKLFSPRYILAGPARTQPFRSLVRVHLDRPGMSANAVRMDQGVSKIPVVYHQDHTFHGLWAQFDGSVKDTVARSTLAASTAGANVNNLAERDLATNIRRAADYTLKLGPPSWDTVFPNHKLTDEQRTQAKAGQIVYAEHCLRCHGEPDGAGGWKWTKGPPDDSFGEIIPIEKIGTDPERVEFRHKEIIAEVVANKFGKDFRKDHPLATFKADDLRAPPGYYAGPIGGAFLRAPYLHNASVLTLAELIGLEPRRDKFYRGRNAYDTTRVGYVSPPVPDKVNHDNPTPHDRNYYFLFDTAERGNSNRGHYYPAWGFGPKRELTAEQTDQLKALLEYLKTL
jgi:hypothetical protein